MSDTRTPRKGKVRAWVVVLVGGLLASGLLALSAFNGIWAEGSSPATAATPAPTRSATATATPSPEPEPIQPMAPLVWEMNPTHLSIPTIGLEGEVTEYGVDNLESMTVEDATGEYVTGMGVNPPSKAHISWDSKAYRQYGLNAILSAQSEYCTPLFGHSYKNEWAVFNDVPGLPAGAEVVMTNSLGETIVYEVVSRQDIYKGDALTALEVRKSQPHEGCMQLVTCFRDGPRDVNGRTLMANILTLQVKSASRVG